MKKIIAAVAALLVMALIVVAFILVPPHLQIRRVEPPLPDLTEVQKLAPVDSGPIRISYIDLASQQFGSRVSGNSVFVIEWEDGRIFMVDAGMDKKTATEFAEQAQRWLGATAPLDFRIAAADALAGRIKHVRGVGFTHLHIDHVQGLQGFCRHRGIGAKVYQSADQANIHNLRTEEGAQIVRDSCLEQVVMAGEGLIQLSEFPGVVMLPVGGHTPGSTIFFVTVGDKIWVLSGDVSNNKRDLLENKGKGFLYSYLIVPENTRQAEKLRLWLSALDAEDNIEVIVSHDAEALASSNMPELALGLVRGE